MQNKLTLLVCDYFLQETRAALADKIFKNVDAIAFAADCDHPLQELVKTDGKTLKITQKHITIGGSCLQSLQCTASENTTTIVIKEQCFELLLPIDRVNHYLEQGAHLFTPAMLEHWYEVNQKWLFSEQQRQDFFRESTSKLVLIDAGISPSASVRMEEIAAQLGLPWEVKTITLDHLRYQLLLQVTPWRLSLQIEKDKQLANYAMINDLLSTMVTLQDEEQVIHNTLDVFHMFCASSNVCYLSIDEHDNNKLFSMLPPENKQEIICTLKQQTEEYQIHGTGFNVLIKRNQQVLGVIAIKDLTFPQYISHYINLSRNIAPVIALAVNNARIYQQQLAAEKKIKGLNYKLSAQLDSVNALNNELETFTYSVSHDLRGPLRSLDGFSNILLRDYSKILDARGQNFLDRIRSNAQRMGQLIDDLLRLSRLTRADLVIEAVNISDIAHELSQDLLQTEPERRVEFIIADNLTAKGDLSLLKAVLENLIGNSWKYTSKCDQAEIEINETLINEKKCFYIRDNGAGFDMKNSAKLFAPFQRLHSADDYSGTGIGLATVQRIIQRHSGKIWAESSPGHGACFYFSLGIIDS